MTKFGLEDSLGGPVEFPQHEEEEIDIEIKNSKENNQVIEIRIKLKNLVGKSKITEIGVCSINLSELMLLRSSNEAERVKKRQ